MRSVGTRPPAHSVDSFKSRRRNQPRPRILGNTSLQPHLSAAEKASCMASSARSRSPRRRTRVARILPESDRYSTSSAWRTCSAGQSGMAPKVANRPPSFNQLRYVAYSLSLNRFIDASPATGDCMRRLALWRSALRQHCGASRPNVLWAGTRGTRICAQLSAQ